MPVLTLAGKINSSHTQGKKKKGEGKKKKEKQLAQKRFCVSSRINYSVMLLKHLVVKLPRKSSIFTRTRGPVSMQSN